MNVEKLTEKSRTILEEAIQEAYEYKHQFVDPLHVLKATLLLTPGKLKIGSEYELYRKVTIQSQKTPQTNPDRKSALLSGFSVKMQLTI